MKVKICFFILIALTLQSCASILNGNYQPVSLETPDDSKILVDGSTPEQEEGQYLLKRDRQAKQLKVSADGYKIHHKALYQYKKSPLHILSWVPFGILLFPPALDIHARSFNYEKLYDLEEEMSKFPKKDSRSKNIYLNKSKISLSLDDIGHRSFSSYKHYLRKGQDHDINREEMNDVYQLKPGLISETLKESLKTREYIDTSKKVLTNSYLNNLKINAEVDEFIINYIPLDNNNMHNGRIINMGYPTEGLRNIIYIDLNIQWEFLDLYGQSLYSKSTHATSGTFSVPNFLQFQEQTTKAVKDAIKQGLINLLSSGKVKELLRDRSQLEKENSFTELVIPKPDSFCSDVSESLMSSVTIKTKSGHGSGFFISSEGHLLTNYHVVSDIKSPKVITHDKNSYEAEIIRVSKVRDLALLKINSKEVNALELDNGTNTKVAKEVYAVGTPSAVNLTQSVSKGVISGIRTDDAGHQIIQTDASVNTGNSGGALIDENANALGIVTSKLTGIGVEGVSFAIPASEIEEILNIKLQ